MSIILVGLSECVICNEIVNDEKTATGLPAFVWNRRDPLAKFHDAVVHTNCLQSSDQRESIEQRLAELDQFVGPGKRRCAVCFQEIVDHNDYLLIPHLVDDPRHPLFRFNYTHLHKSHFHSWSDAKQVLRMMNELEASESWGGPFLIALISELESI